MSETAPRAPDGPHSPDGPDTAVQLHASAVALAGRACLITGRAASGKSTLALEMVALGAELVADDRVDIRRAGEVLLVSAPPAIAGMIEARGVGILRLPVCREAPLAFLVDLDEAETERLPERPSRDILGLPCALVRGRGRAALAAIAFLLLRAGGACDAQTVGTI